jgi:hypothetical protein
MRINGARVSQEISNKLAEGQVLTPEGQQIYDAWFEAAERLKQRMAQIVEDSMEIQSALDTASGGGSMSGLSAYFGELSGAATEVLATLKTPLNEGALSAYDFQTLDELGQVAQAAGQIAGRLSGAAWAKLIQLLSLPVVRAAAVTYIGVKGVGDALNADTAAYRDITLDLNDKFAKGELTAEERAAAQPRPPMSGAAIAAIGVVALGGLAVLLRSKKR